MWNEYRWIQDKAKRAMVNCANGPWDCDLALYIWARAYEYVIDPEAPRHKRDIRSSVATWWVQ